LTDIGEVVENEITALSQTYINVVVDTYVVMPNHVHMILCLDDGGRQNAAPTVSRVIGQWKRSISMKLGYSIWQKSFHDHIIRNETEYQEIWKYIDQNPTKWTEDRYYIK